MGSVAKIAVSLDPEILRKLEELREATGETRSAVVSRALAQLISERELEDRIAAYLEAYRRMPETTAEVDSARELARRSLESLPWDA